MTSSSVDGSASPRSGAVQVASLVLFSSFVSRTAAFYRAIGLQLEEEHHDGGPVHLAVDLGPVHFAIYDAASRPGHAPPHRTGGSAFPGFYVDSLDEARAAVLALGAEIVVPHDVCPWGCRFLAVEPDGRTVEVNQQDHCPESRSSDSTRRRGPSSPSGAHRRRRRGQRLDVR